MDSNVPSFLSMVLKNPGLSSDTRCNGEDEVVDWHSETNIFGSEPQKKRKKARKSFFVNGKYVNKIICWLNNDKITAIGICGMGGIGKTTLSKQLKTRLLNSNIFCADIHAIIAWVSVGTDFTVNELQRKIANAFGIDLDGDKDEIRRSGMIYAFLSRLHKCILFLDDLWTDFRREDVGIPKKCKLIVVSRSQDVCRMLRCQKVIRVEPLSEDESWQLFCHGVEYGVSDVKELSSLRKIVYDECAGLPLAITLLANSMKEEGNASTWREFLTSNDPFFMGPPSRFQDMIAQLKFSYDKLNTKIQRCFLYAALYPKGYAIDKEELIRLWIGERLIDEVESLQVQYDMGHSILNKLINSCLLEPCQDKGSVKLHDLLRRMALSIAGENFTVNMGVPSSSLIPSDSSLGFMNLSTLILQDNRLKVIPESFFIHMPGLRVLSLSHTPIIKLPNSIGDLEELQVLDLNSCKKLKQVPRLGKLYKLRFLNLSNTAIEQVPPTLNLLKTLAELNLSVSPQQTKFPLEVLSALPRLKRLSCHVYGIVNELKELKSLESLNAKFRNVFELSSYVRSQHWSTLDFFHLQVGHQIKLTRPHSRAVSLQGCCLSSRVSEHFVLPFDIRELYLDDCSGFHSLSDIINPSNACGFKQRVEAFTSLEVCKIVRCHDVEKLFAPGWMPNLRTLEFLEVENCNKLNELILEDVENYCHNERKHAAIEFPRLKQIVLASLPQLSSICKGRLVCASIQTLTVTDCLNLKHLPFSNTDYGEILVPSSLEWIEGQQKWWDSLEWDNMKAKAFLQPFFRSKSFDDADCQRSLPCETRLGSER